jgi:regulatory protein
MKPKPGISVKVALERLMKLCSTTEKSSYDIRKKIHDWGLDEASGTLIGLLKRDRFIDDQRFAIAFAKDKIFFNKWGIFKVRFLLQTKQIAAEQINKAIAAIDMKAYREMVFDELRKKQKSLKAGDPYSQKIKIHTFGAQRGYERELINEFFDSNSGSLFS